MTALAAALALSLAAAPGPAPGCPAALAAAGALDDHGLAEDAPGLVARLRQDGGGRPLAAVTRAAEELVGAHAGGVALEGPARRLRAVLAGHCAAAALPALPEASAQERAALDALLARPEFRRARADPVALRRLLLDAWDWIVERLGSAEAERWAGLGRALFLGAAATAAGLALLGWRRRRRGREVPAPAHRAAVAVGPGPDRALARAEAALAQGEHAAAVREAMLAALAALERAGRLPRGRALTNAEVVRAVAARDPALAAPLGPLARRFDGAIYGGRATGAPEARDAVERARAIDAAVRR
ncbi:MAG: DUF4129 domain-containing protein [Anaeromyxobacteraceae bacterium]